MVCWFDIGITIATPPTIATSSENSLTEWLLAAMILNIWSNNFLLQVNTLWPGGKRLVSDQKSTPGIDPTIDDTEDTSRPLYFKWPYHSRGVQAHDLQIIFEKYLKGHVGFEKMTVSSQRPKNLRDLCMSNRVVQEEGKKASQLFSKWNSDLSK